MLILGIDPGIAQTGWGVVNVTGQRYQPVAFGVIKTTTKNTMEQRIHHIANAIGEVAQKHQVEIVSMEDIFFAKNVSSAITVAKVIGAIIQQLSLQKLTVRLFTPLQIKLSVTGYGTAEKHQVQELVRLLLKLDTIPKPDHVADSLAAAICLATNGATENRLRI
ncbi:MAG: crossover junction endodeoxyribonuclease RuvC [Sphaerochaetaceae bacterium]|jgi:crossover junction endodeoxyribonuclease RuvC|nr:crossover junction endodeoxyribonuclease RuvC [Sphaerochaetaceae bacterium]MDD4219072.1 crossover junction endodeoxyribonuclease RuvC [Sphaerochaetaceae bacterium]MDY0371753.1 crossover junction endodeoxyribonuclease RuvC [Sphaerochaetaceae bacterium]